MIITLYSPDQKSCSYNVETEEDTTRVTHIADIMKGPNNIRICGDYEVTINLEVPQHPIPVLEDIAILNKDDNNIKQYLVKLI